MTCRDNVGTTGPDKSESKRYLLVPNCFLGWSKIKVTPMTKNKMTYQITDLVDINFLQNNNTYKNLEYKLR